MKLEQRTYETRAVAEIGEALARHRRVVAVGPTGCGKTVVAAMLIKQNTLLRVLFVAHKYELVNQAHGQLAAHGVRAGVIMAQDEALHGTERVDPRARVQVASIQTAARRGGPERVDLIIVDEAHRIMSASYQDLIAAYPNALVLGLTATPERMDGKSLGDFFQHMVTIATQSELYEAGYLARPAVYVAPEDATAELTKRLKGAAKARGDYTPKALARIVDSGMLVGKVVSEAIRLAPGVPKVVFAGSVKHSQELCERFRKRGVKAAHLDAKTDPHVRERLLEDLRAGVVEVICNVGVLTEGWDLPMLGAVIIARPTRSKTLLFQMAGRVQRPYKGHRPVVLDHGNCCLALGIDPRDDYPWRLGGHERAGGEAVVKACPECQAVIPAGCTECPECGAAQPRTAQQIRDEIDARLVELNRLRRATLSLREYARRRGVSHSAVSEAVKSGKLRDSILMVGGQPKISDPELADREWLVSRPGGGRPVNSIRALARRLGVSHSAIHAAIRRGRVSRGVRIDDSGRVEVVDPAAAEANCREVGIAPGRTGRAKVCEHGINGKSLCPDCRRSYYTPVQCEHGVAKKKCPNCGPKRWRRARELLNEVSDPQVRRELAALMPR